jgi:hypothetical protein
MPPPNVCANQLQHHVVFFAAGVLESRSYVELFAEALC